MTNDSQNLFQEGALRLSQVSKMLLNKLSLMMPWIWRKDTEVSPKEGSSKKSRISQPHFQPWNRTQCPCFYSQTCFRVRLWNTFMNSLVYLCFSFLSGKKRLKYWPVPAKCFCMLRERALRNFKVWFFVADNWITSKWFIRNMGI